MGVMLHLLGDLMTHMKFKPLWPIRNNEIAWHWSYSDGEIANKGFFTLGAIAFLHMFLLRQVL
ncbi:MAG: hypothetical protein JXA91_01315 [Candidatus Thermoplasmatota archaeon]|nr:hypothetical protein [Candidatus Thermoplasmatota archaeon]